MKKTFCFASFILNFITGLSNYNRTLFIIFLFIGFTSSAQVQLVQGGTTTIPNGVSSITVNIPTPVDDTKSMLIVNAAPIGTSSGPGSTNVLSQLNCAAGTCNTIRIQRHGTVGSIDIGWKIVEFENSSTVTVSRGTVQHNAFTLNALPSPDTYTVAIGATNGKSFVLLSDYVQGSVTTWDDTVQGELDGSGNLVLRLGNAKTTLNSGEVAYQVIDYGNAIVKQGNFQLLNDTDIQTIPVPGGIPNPGKSWLIYNYWNNVNTTNAVDKLLIRGSISGNNVVLDRNRNTSNGFDVYGTYYLVEFTDQTLVQHSNMSFTSTETTNTVRLPRQVNPICAVPVIGYHQRGGKAASTGSNMSSAWFIPKMINNGRDLDLFRGETNNVAAEAYWFVLEFDYCSPPIGANDDDFPSPINGSTGGLIGDITTNDSFAGIPDPSEPTITISINNDDGSGAVVDANGNLSVPAGIAPGNYTLQYTICDAADTANCSTANVYFIVEIDTDIDGIWDSNDLDDDNDGITDAQELCGTDFIIANGTPTIDIIIDLDRYEEETTWTLLDPSSTLIGS